MGVHVHLIDLNTIGGGGVGGGGGGGGGGVVKYGEWQ